MSISYCFVDESGQDTKGQLFLVGIVTVVENHEEMQSLCKTFEKQSKKGRLKWRKANFRHRLRYIELVAAHHIFSHALHVVRFSQTREYLHATILAIAKVVLKQGASDKHHVILIDALSASREKYVASQLRSFGIPVKKVVGVRKDENNALIRLADALCGFVRDGSEGNSSMTKGVYTRIVLTKHFIQLL